MMGHIEYPSRGCMPGGGVDFCSESCLLKAVLLRASEDGIPETLRRVIEDGEEVLDEIEEELSEEKAENSPLNVEFDCV